MKKRNSLVIGLSLIYILISYSFDHAVVNRRLLIFFHLLILSLIIHIKLYPAIIMPRRIVFIKHAMSLRLDSLLMNMLMILLSNTVLRILGQLNRLSYITIISYTLFYYCAILILFIFKHYYLLKDSFKDKKPLENDLSTFLLDLIPSIIIALVLTKLLPIPYPTKLFLPLIIGPIIISVGIRIHSSLMQKKYTNLS